MGWINSLPVGKSLEELETQFIIKTLESHMGNRAHTAKTLGICLRTLRIKLESYKKSGFSVIPSVRGKRKNSFPCKESI
jgi:DNA-binding NtrC family response regulator